MPLSHSSGAAALMAVGLIKSGNLNPKIVQQPLDEINVAPGEAKTIIAVARGKAPLTYRWYLNGELLNGETSNTLSTDYGAGEYYLEVSNNYGTVETIKTTVNIGSNSPGSPPLIITHPVNRTISKNQTAQFTVTATGAPALNYEWLRNGEPFGAANSGVLNVSSSHPNYYTDDGSIYSCRVYNSFGSVTSNSAALLITGETPIVVSSPSNRTLLENTTTDLTITATGYPEPLVEWFLPGDTITYTGDEITFIADLSKYSLGKNTVYWRVSNIYGTVNGSVEITINQIIFPTVVHDFPEVINVDVFNDSPLNTSLFGEIQAYPPVTVILKNSNDTIIDTQESYRYSLNAPTYSRSLLGIPEITDSPLNPEYTPTVETIPNNYTFYYTYIYSWPGNITPPQPPPPVEVNTTIRMPLIKSQPPEVVVLFSPDFVDSNNLYPNRRFVAFLWVELYNFPTLSDGGLFFYSWYRNGVFEYTEPGLNVNGYLVVYDESKSGDVYHCVISNSRGYVATRSTTVYMFTEYPIMTDILPNNAVLFDDDMIDDILNPYCTPTVNFEVKTKTTYNPNDALFRWYVNGNIEQDWSTSKLFNMLPNCNCNYDKNYYTVMVEAKYQHAGKVNPYRLSTKLYLYTTPKIISEPQDRTVDAASLTVPGMYEVQFEVDVCRSNNYIYQWYLRSVDMVDTIINGANEKILRILPSLEDDGTGYYCKIALPDGEHEIETRVAMLNILGYNP